MACSLVCGSGVNPPGCWRPTFTGLSLLSQPTRGIFKELFVTGLGTYSSHHVRCVVSSGHQQSPDS